MRLISNVWAAQSGALFLWLPVMYGAGIGAYFLIRFEPNLWLYGALLGVMLLCLGLMRWIAPEMRPVAIAFIVAIAGFEVAAMRAYAVAEPVLSFRYYGPVEGRIVAMDRSQSDKPRLTLDRVVLRDVPRDRTPKRVRVSLHGDQSYLRAEPGLTVIMTAHLSPPQGPVEPGGFDFRRQAWFQGLGAVGYTRVPALALAPVEEGARWWVAQTRYKIGRELRETIGGEAGAVAAAITSGDRSGLSVETTQALRDTNLAHLLAISGLHMGLLVGFVFAAIRYGLALIPRIALYWPVKKIAAMVAMVAGAAYLVLSGGQVATLRAFVMVAVVMLAVLLDRRAITLRSVAIAALIVLSLRPESLMSPGFQMSFAATTALVAVFDGLRGSQVLRGRWWVRAVVATVLSSAVAGFATAPYGAAHFNQISHFGLIANLASVPVMAMVVMPAAVVTAVLSVIGAEAPALWVMARGIDWILWVAGRVAEWPGVTSHVVAPRAWVLPLLSLALLILAIWQGRGRWLGVPMVAVALTLWWGSARPHVLISDSGGLIGVMGSEGRVLSRARGDGFTARVWLENDGAPTDQAVAAARSGFTVVEGGVRGEFEGQTLVHLRGKAGAQSAEDWCRPEHIVIIDQPLNLAGPCWVFDAASLRRTGSVALWRGAEGRRVETVAEFSGDRLWSPAQ